jgi:hypothetical protein
LTGLRPLLNGAGSYRLTPGKMLVLSSPCLISDFYAVFPDDRLSVFLYERGKYQYILRDYPYLTTNQPFRFAVYKYYKSDKKEGEMVTIIEGIFIDLKICELDRKRLAEANFYINVLIENEIDIAKAAAFYRTKIKILRRLVYLNNIEARRQQKENLKRGITSIYSSPLKKGLPK